MICPRSDVSENELCLCATSSTEVQTELWMCMFNLLLSKLLFFSLAEGGKAKFPCLKLPFIPGDHLERSTQFTGKSIDDRGGMSADNWAIRFCLAPIRASPSAINTYESETFLTLTNSTFPASPTSVINTSPVSASSAKVLMFPGALICS